jgi:hypothetical protein
MIETTISCEALPSKRNSLAQRLGAVCDSNPATALNDAKPAGVIAVAILIMTGDEDGLIYPYGGLASGYRGRHDLLSVQATGSSARDNTRICSRMKTEPVSMLARRNASARPEHHRGLCSPSSSFAKYRRRRSNAALTAGS